MKKSLVAYFSASGVTARLAQTLSDAIGADLFEIEPAKRYSAADLNWNNRRSRSSVEMADEFSRPKVVSKVENMADYDVIFVGFPIWWYVAPHIVNSFLEGYDLAGKTVVPFATSGGSGMGRTNEALSRSCRGAVLKNGRRFAGSADKKELAAWAGAFLN